MERGYVYIIFSFKTGKTYTGSSNDPCKRLAEHNAGKTKSTISGIPWRIWHIMMYETLEEARRQERYFKTGAGRSQLKKVLQNISKPV